MKRPKTPKQPLLPGAGKLSLGPRPARRYLEAVRLEREAVSDFDQYPFSIPSIRHLTRLEFHPAVTFFIGENEIGRAHV